jgi:RNA polymerase sigma-70 factor (ECF subfamily)
MAIGALTLGFDLDPPAAEAPARAPQPPPGYSPEGRRFAVPSVRPAAGGLLPDAGDAGSRRVGLAPSDSHHDQDRIRADGALMVAVAAGDESAFARLVGEQSPRLLRFARAMLLGTAEAEEVVQEALVRLWQQAETWQPQGRISTWLHQVTYRLCIDTLRRRRPSVGLEAIENDLQDDEPVPDERLIRLDEARTVQAAIERLPERQRTAILLCHFQNLSQAEAATIMGVGESAYESILARARRKLRVLLAADGLEPDKGGE